MLTLLFAMWFVRPTSDEWVTPTEAAILRACPKPVKLMMVREWASGGLFWSSLEADPVTSPPDDIDPDLAFEGFVNVLRHRAKRSPLPWPDDPIFGYRDPAP